MFGIGGTGGAGGDSAAPVVPGPVAMAVMAGCGVEAGLAVSAESIRTLAMVGLVAVAAMADGCSVAVAPAGRRNRRGRR
ncbi:hypothetical protein MMRN_40280 [Mycobacterium marinum]|nr:hypothetical protein MMRN_40280 [Mycobacterium marinum]